MSIAAEILTTLKADASQFNNAVRGSAQQTEEFGLTTEKVAGIGKGAFLALGATAVAVAGLSVKAASDYETAHARLATTIKNTGSTWDAQKDKVEAVDGQLRKLGFTDTETETSLASLVQVTKDTGKATELMGLAADIAAGRHISLTAATGILQKVEQGRVSTLQRLNIDIKDNEGHVISQEEAIKRLTATYGGAGEAAANTFAGKLKVLEAQLDHVAVQIGEVLIPVLLDIANAGAGAVDFFQRNQELALALAVVIGGPLVFAMGVFIAEQIRLGAVWVFNQITSGIDALQAFGSEILELSAKLFGAGAATAALTGLQAANTVATDALATAEAEAAIAADNLAAAQALVGISVEDMAALEAAAATSQEALTVAQEEATVAAGQLAVAQEEAGVSSLAMLGPIGLTVLGVGALTAGLLIGADALGLWDNHESKAAASGREFADSVVKSITATNTAIEAYKQVQVQLDVTSTALDHANKNYGFLGQGVLDQSKSFEVNSKAQQTAVASSERLRGEQEAYKQALKNLQPEYDRQSAALKKATDEATVTAAVFGVALPKGLDLTQQQVKTLTATIEPLTTLIGKDATQAALNLAKVLPDIGTALKGGIKDAESFGKSIEGSINKFTDAFSSFKLDTKSLTSAQDQFNQFFVGSQLAATKWANDITDLINRGVDKGIIDNIARAGPGAQPALDNFIALVNQNGVDWVNSVSKAGADAAKITEKAYDKMAIAVAIKSAETTAIGKAFFDDLEAHSTANLDALKGTADADFNAMVASAESRLPGMAGAMQATAASVDADALAMAQAVIGAINSIPNNIPITVDAQTAAAQAAFDQLHASLINLTRQQWVVAVAVGGDPLAGLTGGVSDRSVKHDIQLVR